jgi:YbbR domain-containing protein
MVFETSARKVVPVVPGLEGEPGFGYAIGNVATVPASVEVVGPASAVARLTEAITEPVSVAGAKARVTDTVNVGVADPIVRLRVPTTAQVTVDVKSAPAPVR